MTLHVVKSYEFRLAVESDLSDVHDIVNSAYEKYIARLGRRPFPMDSEYARLIANNQVWLCVESNCTFVVVVVELHADHVLIENVAVRPDMHGAGIGSRLLEFAENTARSRGIYETRLYTNEMMTENVEFYPRRGYVETHRAKYRGITRVYFSKQLLSDDNVRRHPSRASGDPS